MKETLKQEGMLKEYEVILAGAGSAGIASFLYALKKGKSFIAAFLDFAIGAVVGGAVAGMLFYWFGWPIYLVGAACTVFGIGIDRVLFRVNGIIDAAGDRAEKEIRGLDLTKKDDSEPTEKDEPQAETVEAPAPLDSEDDPISQGNEAEPEIETKTELADVLENPRKSRPKKPKPPTA